MSLVLREVIFFNTSVHILCSTASSEEQTNLPYHARSLTIRCSKLNARNGLTISGWPTTQQAGTQSYITTNDMIWYSSGCFKGIQTKYVTLILFASIIPLVLTFQITEQCLKVKCNPLLLLLSGPFPLQASFQYTCFLPLPAYEFYIDE